MFQALTGACQGRDDPDNSFDPVTLKKINWDGSAVAGGMDQLLMSGKLCAYDRDNLNRKAGCVA